MKTGGIDGKNVMHIDTSVKLYQRKNTGIACIVPKTDFHKGAALSIKLKSELERDLDAAREYARIYAIVIFYLIKDDLDKFDTLIICGDENFTQVKGFLDILFEDYPEFFKKNVHSISEYREITGDTRLRSAADHIARAYRKRALRSLQVQQTGRTLNKVPINYGLISEKWQEIDKKLK